MRVLDRKITRSAYGTGGGGSEEITLTGESPLVLTNVASGIKSLRLTGGAITQEGTPTPDDPKPILIGGKELKISADGVPYVEGQELVVSGVNLWDEEWEAGGILRGENYPDARLIRSKNYISVSPNSDYYIQHPTQNNGVYELFFYDNEYAFVNSLVVGAGGVKEFETPELAHYMRFRCYQAYGTTYNHDICISPFNTNGKYYPYSGASKEIPLPLLIGDDEADITKGEVVRKWGVVDLGTLNWAITYSQNMTTLGYRVGCTDLVGIIKIPSSPSVALDCKCSAYPTKSANITYLGNVGISVEENGRLSVYDPNYKDGAQSTIAAFKAAMSGVLFMCPLATDTTSQIPPTSVPLIKPTSVLTSYASSIEATYKAKQKPTPWFEYVIGLNTSVDYSSKTDLTAEGLANIILNSAPTHAIVIKLSASDYDKCASGGAWNTEISSALSTKPLVSIAK